MKTKISGAAGQSLLEGLRGAEKPLRAPCAGRGRCGKCRVVVLTKDETLLAPIGRLEAEHLGPAERARGVRLACLATFARTGELELEQGDDGIAVPSEWPEVIFDPAIQEASRTGRPLRVAVDIGTTTLAVALTDAAAGHLISVKTGANPQKSWGSDVVARIQVVIDDPASLESMSKAVVGQIEALVREQILEAGRRVEELDLVVVAGNTVMLHLFAGEDPTGMARVPFRPAFLETRTLTAPETGFDFPAACRILLLPGISAFVGADITAGVLASGLFEAEETELLLDIGTNGEMVLGSRHAMIATATAAGPAFEGAQITHGCPGVPGALDHAGWGDGFWYTTIGDRPLTGICGSGLLDLVAALRQKGHLDETGFLELPEGEEAFRPDVRSEVVLSQGDIRQLQLAKGAIAAGVQILCRKAGITPEAVTKVHLAGGFGTLMSPESALAIGLLPLGLRGKIVPAGNTSLKGALRVLSQSDTLAAAVSLAARIETVDLSAEAEFQSAFAEAMLFPEDGGDDVSNNRTKSADSTTRRPPSRAF